MSEIEKTIVTLQAYKRMLIAAYPHLKPEFFSEIDNAIRVLENLKPQE